MALEVARTPAQEVSRLLVLEVTAVGASIGHRRLLALEVAPPLTLEVAR